MMLELENHCQFFSGSDILSSSWMPDEIDGRIGWLACGTKAGSISITKTMVAGDDDTPGYKRTVNNHNVRNVKVPINIVEWNPHHQKLATCSSTGSILVYHKVNDQWSVDLVNERAHAVEVFKWSRSTNQVMIGYTDGLLIVGSVSGHRLWHRMMDMHSVLTQGSGYNHSNRTPNQHPVPRSDEDTDTSNLSLFENVLRNNPEDTVMVSRNYRRTSDISTFYHADSVNRFRYFSNRQVIDEPYPRMYSNHNYHNTRRSSNSSHGVPNDQSPTTHFEDMPTLTCGTWSPNDVTITVGTSIGSLLSFPYAWERLPLRLVRQKDRLLRINDSILQIEWSCPVFRKSDNTETNPSGQQLLYLINNHNNYNSSPSFLESEERDYVSFPEGESQLYDDSESHVLAVSFSSGYLYILRNLEDLDPLQIQTGLSKLFISWNGSGTMLATAGFVRSANLECHCSVKLFSVSGDIIYVVPVPSMDKPIMSVTWAHEDSRLFVTASVYVHTFRINKTYPPLTERCCYTIRNCLRSRTEFVEKLCLPSYLRTKIYNSFKKTIQGILPLPFRLKEFVLLPKSELIQCIFNKIHSSNGLSKYILYLEFLGAQIPLLVAVRSRSVKYEYIIYDSSFSQFQDKDNLFPYEEMETDHFNCTNQCVWLRKFKTQARLQHKTQGRNSYRLSRGDMENNWTEFVQPEHWAKPNNVDTKQCKIHELMLDDDLPESMPLAKLKSNVPLTKFELISCQLCLPQIMCRINFGANMKLNPSNLVSIQVMDIDDTTGWKMANFYRDYCLQMRGLTVSCYAGTALTQDLSLSPLKANLSFQAKQNARLFSVNSYESSSIVDTDSATSSCYSSPTHWCYSPYSKGNKSFSQIKSLPSTPKKMNTNLSKRIRLVQHNNNYRDYPLPIPPSFHSIFISNHPLSSTKSEIKSRVSKKITLFHDNEEVLNFGRIENDKYSLEFKYPFSPLQAFVVGISNISRLFK